MKKRIIVQLALIMTILIAIICYAKDPWCKYLDCSHNARGRGFHEERVESTASNYTYKQGDYIIYEEKRGLISYNDQCISIDSPKEIHQLIEGNVNREGAQYYQSNGCLAKFESDSDSENKYSWNLNNVANYSWPNANASNSASGSSGMFNYVEASDEALATFLCVNDTVRVTESGTEDYLNKFVAQYYKGLLASTEQVWKNAEETAKVNANLRQGRVVISNDDGDEDVKNQLLPGEYFYIYVSNKDLKAQFSNNNKNFEKLNWKWAEDSAWKECKYNGSTGWYKRKAQVKTQITGSNKIRIATKYSYVNFYAKANVYYGYRSYVDEDGEAQTEFIGILTDPMEASQTVNRTITIEIPLKCEVSINQYVSSVYQPGNSVEYSSLQYITKASGNWQMTTCNNGSRRSWEETTKNSNPVVLENGAKVVYKVEVTNNNPTEKNGKKVPAVYVGIKDTLPGVIKNKNNGTIKITATDTTGRAITKTISVAEDTKIEQTDWPLVNNKGNLEIKSKQTIVFTIEATVNATTGSTAVYNYDKTAKATAKILYASYVNINKFRTTKSNTYPQGKTPYAINTAEKQQAQDFLVCKKYNMTIDKYISDVKRNNGGNLETGEYQVVDNNYAVGIRSGKTSANKSINEVFVENGDIVTYTIALHNNASANSPYFSPESLSVVLEDTLPKNVEIISVQASTGIENKIDAPTEGNKADDEDYEAEEEEDNIER